MADPDTRTRLVAAMGDALRRRGLHGVGLNEILAAAGAPKGVLYHHFPGGKTELAIAAIDDAATGLGRALDKVVQRGANPEEALLGWLAAGGRQLGATGFERGCPLATVALESGPGDTAIRAALATAFAAIRERIADALRKSGRDAAEATGLASLIVAAYEGGLLQARVANSAAPMNAMVAALAALLADRPKRRAGR